MGLGDTDFFAKQTISSMVKAKIITEYFPSYCQIITKAKKPREIRYLDLFSGPGIYNDGSWSTPLLIGKQVSELENLRTMVQLVFNDNKYCNQLKSNFTSCFPEGTFVKTPRFGDKTIGEDEHIDKWLVKNTHENNVNPKPSLLFIDPFGYKGIETSVLARFLSNWGNELFIFVNIKRIHPALENDKFNDLMVDLFPTTLSTLRNDRRYLATTAERIQLIIDKLGQEYESILKSKIYYTAFKFQEEDNSATSHYILHLTKHHRGFDLVKQIYTDFANVGTVFDGRNTYTFDPKLVDSKDLVLFDAKQANLDKLKSLILRDFEGKTLTALQLFEAHQKDVLYSRQHYAVALRQLVEEGKATAVYTDGVTHIVTVLLSPYCKITIL
jgi:three-Cys-motif partner protein